MFFFSELRQILEVCPYEKGTSDLPCTDSTLDHLEQSVGGGWVGWAMHEDNIHTIANMRRLIFVNLHNGNFILQKLCDAFVFQDTIWEV